MSTKETMNLTTALQQASVLNDRIHKAVQESTFAGITLGDKQNSSNPRFKTKQEMEDRIKADAQSVAQLIRRRNAIRAGIVLANATTMVNVGGEQMTIAAAVERKRNLFLEEMHLQHMETSYTQTLRDYDQKVKSLDAQVLALVTEQYKGENQGKPPTQEQVESVKTIQYKQYGPQIVDPLQLNDLIIATRKSIETFKDNVDNELSRINAVTNIEVEY